jgi:hypothetical protein
MDPDVLASAWSGLVVGMVPAEARRAPLPPGHAADVVVRVLLGPESASGAVPAAGRAATV